MSKQLIVSIDKYGTTKIDAQGFQGDSCIQATQAIEVALAGDVGLRHLKPEFDEPTAVGGELENTLKF